MVEIWPIFYACGETSMHAWLASHALEDTESAFAARLSREVAPFADDLALGGFAYYRYGAFPNEACAEAIGATPL